MIRLSPPYWFIDGVTVLSDHEDDSLFYALPASPQIHMDADGTPAFNLTQYLGGGTGDERIEGGLLTLTTELGLAPDVLQSIASRLREKLPDPPAQISVVPVLFESGEVELIALGASSASGDEDAGASNKGPFEIETLGSGKASLDAQNTSSFQLVVDANAAQLIEQCLEDPALPILAVYRMKFAGLRPSFDFNVTADWRKVYRKLEQRAKVNAYFVTADADTAISEAIESQDIQIEMTVSGTDEFSRSSATQARKQLTEWVLENLCQPMIPKDGASDISRVADDVLGSLVRTIVPGVSYRLRALSETQLRNLSASMQQSVAVLQEVVPQGTLGALLQSRLTDETGEPVFDKEEIRSRLLTKVNLNGFPRLEVKVGVEDRFAVDGVSEVIVDLARKRLDDVRDDRSSFSFRDASTTHDYIVNLLGEAPAVFPALYEYRLETRFDPAHAFGRHDALTTDWLPGRTAQLIVEPRSVYSLREITLAVSPTFSFDLYPTVTVELEYEEEEGSAQRGRVVLQRDAQIAKWSYRAHTIEDTCFAYTVTYHRQPGAGASIAGKAQIGCSNWISIEDPLPRKRTLTLLCALPWDEIILALARVKYEDSENDIQYDEQIVLDPATRFIRKDFAIAENGPRQLEYRLTIMFTDGRRIDGSWRETDDERIVLDRKLVEQKAVRVRCLGGTLDDAKLSKVKVLIQARDADGQNVRHEKEFAFASETSELSSPVWEFPLGDPPLGTIYYKGIFITRDGFVEETPWTSTDGDLLIVHVKNRTIRG